MRLPRLQRPYADRWLPSAHTTAYPDDGMGTGSASSAGPAMVAHRQCRTRLPPRAARGLRAGTGVVLAVLGAALLLEPPLSSRRIS